MSPRSKTVAAGTVAAVASVGSWWYRHREDRPYGPHWMVDLPRPGISRQRLLEILSPHPGERLLEVGPGYGYYSVAVARELQPRGTLELLDVRQTLLDQVAARAAAEGVANIHATLGDGRRLPYPDDGFDALYLVACLGEMPDRHAAMHEFARVIRPGGRLVIGETIADPHHVRAPALTEMAQTAGLRAGAKIGRRSYFARFQKPEAR